MLTGNLNSWSQQINLSSWSKQIVSTDTFDSKQTHIISTADVHRYSQQWITTGNLNSQQLSPLPTILLITQRVVLSVFCATTSLLVLGKVPGSCSQVNDTKKSLPGTWYQILGPNYFVTHSRYRYVVAHPGIQNSVLEIFMLKKEYALRGSIYRWTKIVSISLCVVRPWHKPADASRPL